MDFETYASEQFEALQSKLDQLESQAADLTKESVWGIGLRTLGIVIMFAGILLAAMAVMLKHETRRIEDKQESLMSSVAPNIQSLRDLVPDIQTIKSYVLGTTTMQSTVQTIPNPKGSEATASPKLTTPSVVYVPVLDDFYNGKGTLQGTSLFENMFTLASPHPTIDDKMPQAKCQGFSFDNPAVVSAITNAVKTMPAFASYSIKINRLDAVPAPTADEYGVLVSFMFADGGGVVGNTQVKASVKEDSCNVWSVTAIGTGGGEDWCKSYRANELNNC